jgi:hypothetical protein
MIVCGACGHENPDTSEFCKSCGRFLEYTRTPQPDQPAPRPPGRATPPEPGPQTLRDPVVTIDLPAGPAGPGESLILRARVRNASSIVDRVSLTIVGPSAAWWKVEPASVSLYPATEADVRLEFRPPKSPDLPAGPTRVGLLARTDLPDVRMTTSEFEIVVGPITDVSSELVPRTSHGRRTGHHVVNVANAGNAPWRAAVRAVDPDARLHLSVTPENAVVPAGGRASVEIAAGGRGFNFLGPPDVTPFVIELRPADGGPLITHEARFEQPSLFRVVPLAIATGLAAAVLVVAAVLAGWVKIPPPPPSPTPTASAATPTPTSTSRASETAGPSETPTATPDETPTPTPIATPTPPAVDQRAQQWADELNFGPPIGVTIPTSDGAGLFQAFEKGVVYVRPDGTAVPMFGDILGHYTCLIEGQPGIGCHTTNDMPPSILDTLGYPSAREDEADGEPFQIFDLGGIYCLNGCGSAVFQPLEPIWQTFRGPLGLPVRDQIQTDQFNNAWLGRFQNGFLMVDPGGVDWFACGYDGSTISSSGIPTDCTGWAAYVKSLGD